MGHRFLINGEQGIVLVVSLMFMALLSILAATAYVVSTQDAAINANYKYSEQAFNHAEAGVQYGVVKLEMALKSGVSFPESGQMNIPGGEAPGDFSFSLSPLTVEGMNLYGFTSTGISQKNASSQIKVGLKRLPVVPGCIFGDLKIDSKTHVHYYSYDSRVMLNPVPSDSTGKANLVSNGSIALDSGTLVDGDVVLGNNYTNDATYHPSGAPVVTGENGINAGRLEPDPLNVNSAAFQDEFDLAQSTNDNRDITPSLSGVQLVHPGGTVTFPGKAGGSVFYLERIELNASDILEMDTSNGPITLYLRGTFSVKDHSRIQILFSGSPQDVTINITEDSLNPVSVNHLIAGMFGDSILNPSGSPAGFSIITDSDGKFEIQDASETNALIYAPNAQILLSSSKPVKGAFLGKTIVCDDHATVFFDTALKDKFLSNDLAIISWKKMLN